MSKMSKTQFLADLKYRLRKLPHDDYEEAMTYYEEYFAEADNDQAAIRELGTPEQVAAKIFADSAAKPKGGLGALAIILIICSFPILLPIGLALFALLVALFAVLFALFAAACAIIVYGAVSALASLALIAVNPLTMFLLFGLGLFLFMLGYFAFRGLVILSRAIWRGLAGLGIKVLRRFAK